jgi:hypothetical protein
VTRNPRQLYDIHLRDPLISRRPERDVFVPMLAHALNRHAELTRRQQYIEVLVLEALARDISPRKVSRYVSERAGVGMRAVQYIVKRIEARKHIGLENLENLFAFAPEQGVFNVRIDEKRLGRIQASVPRQCAGAAYNADCTHHAPGTRPLCRACFEKFVIANGGFMPDHIREAARRIKAQHRRDCVEIMMTRALVDEAV